MRVITPRHPSFSLDYTPKQWVGFCNTLLLLFVTFMFGLVIYNMNSVDQRLVRVLDTSVVAIDLLTNDILQSQTTSFWRTISEDLSVYSAFRRDIDDSQGVLFIGSSSRDVIDVGDLRCLIKYEGEEDDIGVGFVDYRKPSDCHDTVFVYCRTKRSAVPKTVALVSDSNPSPKWLEVRTIPKSESSGSLSIASCVRPFTVDVTPKEIAEFVAFYEILGVSHFYFYNRNAPPDVLEFARELKGMGRSIHLLPWNIQDRDPPHCSVEWSGYVQDCSHRAAGKFDYVLTVDVMDYLVLNNHLRLPPLVEDARGRFGNFTKLGMSYANFCEVLRSKTKVDERIALKRMVVRGGMRSSISNFVLRPEAFSSFQSNDESRTRNATIELVGNLTETEALVHYHTKRCDKPIVMDQSAFKYMDLVDESNVVRAFRRSRGESSNLITLAPPTT